MTLLLGWAISFMSVNFAENLCRGCPSVCGPVHLRGRVVVMCGLDTSLEGQQRHAACLNRARTEISELLRLKLLAPQTTL